MTENWNLSKIITKTVYKENKEFEIAGGLNRVYIEIHLKTSTKMYSPFLIGLN